MRTWTLAFMAAAALCAGAAIVGLEPTVLFIARLLFLAGVVLAILAGIRSATLQMAEDGGPSLPADCTRGCERMPGGRRREDAQAAPARAQSSAAARNPSVRR